jgi:hypothetical protein
LPASHDPKVRSEIRSGRILGAPEQPAKAVTVFAGNITLEVHRVSIGNNPPSACQDDWQSC